MKTKFLITILIAVAQSGISLPLHAKEIDISVKGMVCAFCAQGIEKKFKALKETGSVDVSLEKKLVKVQTKADEDIPDTKINQILTDAGYTVESIKR